MYIGCGSKKFGLSPSTWMNMCRIGKDGTRDDVLALFSQYLESNSSLLAKLPELANTTLLCHCAPKDKCHGDLLADLYWRYLYSGHHADAATSDEDSAGHVKPRKGAGSLGQGLPVQVG